MVSFSLSFWSPKKSNISDNMWNSEVPSPFTVTHILLQEGGLFPGPKSGCLSNTQKWIVPEDTHAHSARDFIGKGHLGRVQEGKGT